MTELDVVLDFACCFCGQALGVTLKCAGEGLGEPGMATVKIPCPHCQKLNQLYFEPNNGSLHHVAPTREPRGLPQPCWN